MKTWEEYTYRVSYSAEDGEFVGLCAELSGLSWLATSPEAALRGIRRAAQEAVDLLNADGEPVPAPLSSKRYSGVFKVRVPPEVHRRLALDAAEQGVSMNRLISSKLSASDKIAEGFSPLAAPRKRATSAASSDQRLRAARSRPRRKSS